MCKNVNLVYIHSLDFALIIYVTKIRQFQVSQFSHGTGPILPFVVLALSQSYGEVTISGEDCKFLPILGTHGHRPLKVL